MATDPGGSRRWFAHCGLAVALSVLAAGCRSGVPDVVPTSTSAAAPCASGPAPASAGCWRQVLPLGSGGFPPSPAMVEYQDRLWLFGGADHIADDRSTDRFRNDVWLSDDGLDWRQVTAAAPWPARDDAGILVFADEFYLVGGHGMADVWRSPDGRAWTQVARAAPWGLRHGAARTVFDGKLWVFGGWKGKSTNALNDVWYSADGATWARQTEHAPWAPRSPVTVVYDDKIWIYSGKHTGADDNWGGDLWQMTAPAGR